MCGYISLNMKRATLVDRELLTKTNMDLLTQENVEKTIKLASTTTAAAAVPATLAKPKKPKSRKPKSKDSVKRVLNFDDTQDDNAVTMEAKPPAAKRSRTTKAKKCNAGPKTAVLTELSAAAVVVNAPIVTDTIDTTDTTIITDADVDKILEDVVDMTSVPGFPLTFAELASTKPPQPEAEAALVYTPPQQQQPEVAPPAAPSKKPKAAPKKRTEKSAATSAVAAATSSPEEFLDVYINNGYVCSKVRIKGKRLTRISTIGIDLPFSARLVPVASMRYTIISAFEMSVNKWVATLHIHNEDTFIEAQTPLIKFDE